MTSLNSKNKVEEVTVTEINTYEPKVSFVVPVYKTEKYLKKCLESLLNQEYKNIEIQCVLDGDSIDAHTIIKKLRKKDARINKEIVIEHSGAPAARNAGYKYIFGEYVSFWDSDCYAEPGMVRMWVKTFFDKKVDFVYSGYRFNDENASYMPSKPFNKYTLTCNNYIATMFPMKRSIFPGFDESLKSLQDWDLWLTLVNKGYNGYFLEGSGFVTEAREGISSEGCTNENWLERYKKIREKHGIRDRKICFTSLTHNWRAMNIAELTGQDYQDNPSFKPNEYEMVYLIGFYPSTMNQESSVFANLPKNCKKIIHWMGDDIEQFLMVPYKIAVTIRYLINDTITKHYCESEVAKQMLSEIGINATVLPLPMEATKFAQPKSFKVYYEFDSGSRAFIDTVIRSCPDITFENNDVCKLEDYGCFLSITDSIVPSENIKRFLLAGKHVITNYKIPYGNYTEPNIEIVIKKLRDIEEIYLKKNKKAAKYYADVLDVNKFTREMSKCLSK